MANQIITKQALLEHRSEPYLDVLSDEELMHFGIMGMRWGHRKAQEKTTSKKTKPKGKATKSTAKNTTKIDKKGAKAKSTNKNKQTVDPTTTRSGKRIVGLTLKTAGAHVLTEYGAGMVGYSMFNSGMMAAGMNLVALSNLALPVIVGVGVYKVAKEVMKPRAK